MPPSFHLNHHPFRHHFASITIRDAKSSVTTDYNRFFTSLVTVRFQSKTDLLTVSFIYKKTDKKTDQLIKYSKRKKCFFLSILLRILLKIMILVFIYIVFLFFK